MHNDVEHQQIIHYAFGAARAIHYPLKNHAGTHYPFDFCRCPGVLGQTGLPKLFGEEIGWLRKRMWLRHHG